MAIDTGSSEVLNFETTDVTGRIPVVEVAFRNTWWSIPRPMSQELYAKYVAGEDAVYTWDWEETRPGSWVLNGEATSISRYIIDFQTMVQQKYS